MIGVRDPSAGGSLRTALAVPAAIGTLGVAVVGYAAGIERNAFHVREVEVPVLPAGTRELRVLHVSDVHITPDQRRKRDFVAGLVSLEPDLVVDTGDNLGSRDGVPAMLSALDPLLSLPGAFVLGSNDYYAPRPKNPLKYFFPGHKRVHGESNPWPELVAGMRARGWVDLTNRRAEIEAGGRRIALAGVDDPHLRRDDPSVAEVPAERTADVRIAVVHAPEPRVLDRFARSGYDLMLCGHTHGGQLRVPGFGALVTNCGIDRARARGLSRYAGAWLHVSPGLGTSPYAPVRFACRPEVTLLRLVPHH
ncbi:MAG TPA: metallophosphoesterase [Mycobacteriales bacterium]|nr:metallophosphoesterase [Mycobacteriales bacterium]